MRVRYVGPCADGVDIPGHDGVLPGDEVEVDAAVAAGLAAVHWEIVTGKPAGKPAAAGKE
jgi:hypothetical protein